MGSVLSRRRWRRQHGPETLRFAHLQDELPPGFPDSLIPVVNRVTREMEECLRRANAATLRKREENLSPEMWFHFRITPSGGGESYLVRFPIFDVQSNMRDVNEALSAVIERYGQRGSPAATRKTLRHLPKCRRTLTDPCPICWDTIEKKGTLLPCQHAFHRECAVHWLKIHRTCPVCRRDVELGEHEH